MPLLAVRRSVVAVCGGQEESEFEAQSATDSSKQGQGAQLGRDIA